MNENPAVFAIELQLKAQREFQAIVERCRNNLLELDLPEIRAMCLTILSQAARGSPAVLLQKNDERGDFVLELSSGPLPRAVQTLVLKLSSEEQEMLNEVPEKLTSLAAFCEMAKESFGYDDIFGRALREDGTLSGVVLLISRMENGFSPEEYSIFNFLAQQMEELIKISKMVATLMELAMVDDLTGLFNNRYFLKRLKSEIARASRHNHQLSLMFCEIADLSVYHNNHGKLAGSRLQKEISNAFSSSPGSSGTAFSFRSSDVPIHYGGGEFVVVLPETNKQGAQTKADRLKIHVESTVYEGQEVLPLKTVTLSIGIATFPDDAADAASLLEAADRALYRAKENGKNRVEVFTPNPL